MNAAGAGGIGSWPVYSHFRAAPGCSRTQLNPPAAMPLAGFAKRLLNDALAAPVEPAEGNVAPDESRGVN